MVVGWGDGEGWGVGREGPLIYFSFPEQNLCLPQGGLPHDAWFSCRHSAPTPPAPSPWPLPHHGEVSPSSPLCVMWALLHSTLTPIERDLGSREDPEMK